MVVKLTIRFFIHCHRFESSVISYGGKTKKLERDKSIVFESSVISYGGKTENLKLTENGGFESSVISYGGKTII